MSGAVSSRPNRGRALRVLLVGGSVALCIAGIGSVTQGVGVPVKAQVAQVMLKREFEQRRAAHLSSAPTTITVHAAARQDATTSAPMALSAKSPPVNLLPAKGPVARLTVERLGIDEIVLGGGTSHDELARGPGVVKQADEASPVTVLAAHRDTHFLFIRDLREGDEVNLELVSGEVQRYRVTRFETVRWNEFAYPSDPARPLLALATCYPFGGTEYGGPWRRVAWAERL